MRELRICRAAALAGLIAGAAGCARGESRTRGESPRPTGAPLSVGVAPRLVVGETATDTLQQFFRVVTPFLLPDGRLVVPNAADNTLRVFGADGTFVARLGGSGEGPGEIGFLAGAWARGDTVEAFDHELMRLTRWAPGREPEVVLPHTPHRMDMVVPGTLGDGWLALEFLAAGDGQRDQLAFERLDRSGAAMGEVGRAQGFARYSAEGMGGPEPLSPRPLYAVAAGRAYIGESLTPRIDVFDAAGAKVGEVATPAGPAADPSRVMKAVIDSAVALAKPERAALTRRQLEAAPVPERLSVVWALLVDELGFVWTRPYDPMRDAAALGGLRTPTRGGSWSIHAPDGTDAGTITLPPDLEPSVVTHDAVVGVRRDENGVESVRVYALTRQP